MRLSSSRRSPGARRIKTAHGIEELIAFAKKMREANARDGSSGLSDEELSFYGALGTNGSPVKVLGESALKKIARRLAETVHRSVSIDWTIRENVRAQTRILVKRVLRKCGYPPDKQERSFEFQEEFDPKRPYPDASAIPAPPG